MARFCTLEEAMATYRLPHEQLLEDLQRAIGNTRTPAGQTDDSETAPAG
jgi:hypothetical protein